MNSKRVTQYRSRIPFAPKRPVAIAERFQLLLDCRDEAEQRKLYEELARRGLKCRVWVV